MEIVTEGKFPEIPAESEMNPVTQADIGIAVDLGTTTIVVTVWSLFNRKNIATVAEKNNQVKYGSDVIKRISFATRPPLMGSADTIESSSSALHYCVVCQLEKMFTKAMNNTAGKFARGISPHINSIVITGNTTMLSFLCSVPVKTMATAPFTPASKFDIFADWQDIRDGKACKQREPLDRPTADALRLFETSVIPPNTKVYIPPCIGAFIGADTTCAMLAAGIPVPPSNKNTPEQKAAAEQQVDRTPVLIADIGTNSEIALYQGGETPTITRILCTSAAAGPAFEAANIACGMSAVEGAIDNIDYKDGRFICHVIGEGHAKGICGSGLISGIAMLYDNNFIDKNGVIIRNKETLGDGTVCIQLTPAVYISQQDIRNLQLAKSALRTGIEYLLARIAVRPKFYIAGGFGTLLNIDSAITIGLLPEDFRNSIQQIGNAALSGAAAMLFSKAIRNKGRNLAKSSIQINLAAIPDFQDRFLSNLEFGNTMLKSNLNSIQGSSF